MGGKGSGRKSKAGRKNPYRKEYAAKYKKASKEVKANMRRNRRYYIASMKARGYHFNRKRDRWEK